MTFTTDNNAPSTIEIQQQVSDLQNEVQMMKNRQAAIEAEIADRWNQDNTELENEHGRLAARIKSSESVFSRLETQRLAAVKREALVAYAAIIDGMNTSATEANAVDVKLAKVIEKMIQLNREHSEKVQLFHHWNWQTNGARRACEVAGATAEEMDAIMHGFYLGLTDASQKAADEMNIRL